MNKHPTALMLSLIGLLLAMIGLAHLQKIWKPILIAAAVAGAILWWVVYFNLLAQSLW